MRIFFRFTERVKKEKASRYSYSSPSLHLSLFYLRDSCSNHYDLSNSHFSIYVQETLDKYSSRKKKKGYRNCCSVEDEAAARSEKLLQKKKLCVFLSLPREISTALEISISTLDKLNLGLSNKIRKRSASAP